MGLIFCLIIFCVILSSCVCLVPIQTNNTDIRLPCSNYETIEFAKIKVMNIPNNHQAIHIECEQGYTLKGKHKLLCSNGQWDQVPRPQCLPNLCRNPFNISNGDITIEGGKEAGMYKKGTLVTYICDNGYRLVPPESKYRVCEKGIWTGVLGKCVLISCKPPRDIENGYYVLEKKSVGEEFNVGQRVYYSCNSGYILNGPTVQHCIDGGTWSPRIPHPVCVLKISGK